MVPSPVGKGKYVAEYRGYELATPPTDAAADNSAYTMGLEFLVTSQAWAKGIWFWQPSTNSPSSSIRSGAIITVDTPTTGTIVSPVLEFDVPVPGWNYAEFDEPFELTINQRYKASVLQPAGRYSATPAYFSTGDGAVNLVNGPLTIVSSFNASSPNGAQMSFNVGGSLAFPSGEFGATHYWVDVSVIDELPPVPGSGSMSISDQARVNLLDALNLDEPQLMSNVDLMRLLLETPGQTLVTATSATAAVHYWNYLIELRDA